jgi:8-oxo-dGTP diphosphatase
MSNPPDALLPDALLYVSQKAFIRDRGRVLTLNDPGFGLDFPGGKLQDGETDLVAALRREVEEETSLEIDIGSPFVTWLDPRHPFVRLTGRAVLLVGYRCRLMSGTVRLSAEHDAYRWIEAAEIGEIDDGSTYAAALRTYFDEAPP